MEMHFVESSMI